MIRTRFASTIALAALLSTPVFAQTMTTSSATTSSTAQQPSGSLKDATTGATKSATAKSSPTASTGSQAMPRSHDAQVQANAQAQGRTPLCSELHNPNAGKLADKTTGMAQDNSASAVHMDCLPDGSTNASAGAGTNLARSGTASNPTATGTKGAKAPSSNTGR
jgi:hypothetical protein